VPGLFSLERRFRVEPLDEGAFGSTWRTGAGSWSRCSISAAAAGKSGFDAMNTAFKQRPSAHGGRRPSGGQLTGSPERTADAQSPV